MNPTSLPVVRNVFDCGCLTVGFSFFRGTEENPPLYSYKGESYTHLEFVLAAGKTEIRFLETTLPTMAAVLRAACASLTTSCQLICIGSFKEELPNRELCLYYRDTEGYGFETRCEGHVISSIWIPPIRIPMVLAALESIPTNISVNKRFEKRT